MREMTEEGHAERKPKIGLDSLITGGSFAATPVESAPHRPVWKTVLGTVALLALLVGSALLGNGGRK